MKKYSLIIFIAFFIFSCNQDTKKIAISFDTNKLKAEEQKYLQKMENAKDKVYDYSNNFTPEELKEFLPTKIDNFETLPNSIGTQSNDDGRLSTFAKAQFQNNERQTIIVDIFDFGKDGEVPDIENYSNPPKDLDAPSHKYVDEFASGFINIDKKLDYGRLEVLINNRFVVVVRLNRNIKDNKQLIDIYKKINLDKIKSIK